VSGLGHLGFLELLGLLLSSLLGLLLSELGLLGSVRVLLLNGLSISLGLDLLELESLLGLHLLLDLEHLELGLSLSSRELMLSLQASEVSLGSCLLGGGSLSLLHGLSSKELLLHALSFELLSGLLFLELLKLGSTGHAKSLLHLALLLGSGDFTLKLLVLLDLELALLLLNLKLSHKLMLLILLLLLKIGKSSALSGSLSEHTLGGGTLKGKTLRMGLFSGLSKGLLHGGELLDFAGALGLLDSFDLHDEALLDGGLGLDLFLVSGLIFLGHLLDLLPRFLSLLGGLHGLLVGFGGGLLISSVGDIGSLDLVVIDSEGRSLLELHSLTKGNDS